MREWLSGGALPCQGRGRGFDPRLALFIISEFNPIAVYGVKLYTIGSAFMKIIRKIIICILIIIIAYCAYNIIIYYTDSYNNKKGV